jgi:hypothetical protein
MSPVETPFIYGHGNAALPRGDLRAYGGTIDELNVSARPSHFECRSSTWEYRKH